MKVSKNMDIGQLKTYIKGMEHALNLLEASSNPVIKERSPKVNKTKFAPRIPWTEMEIDILKNNPGMTAKELSESIPNHTIQAINFKRLRMGIKSGKRGRPATLSEREEKYAGLVDLDQLG